MVDLHNHLIPGVDDGSSDLEQSRAALDLMRSEGVDALITTPHLRGSITRRPDLLAARLEEVDAAWERLHWLVKESFLGLRVERGMEVMLDIPVPDLSDPRVRLAGTSFVLVEFPYMTVPPNSSSTIFELRMQGWTPVIAHPERYSGVDEQLEVVSEWRRVGGLLQVNCGSLVGRYGDQAKSTAWRLLRRGWVDYLSSDYHARGRCAISEAREKLIEKGGEEQARFLFEVNPGRLLAGEAPEPVPPFQPKKPSLWDRFFRSSRS